MIGYIKHYINIDLLREREQKRLYIREGSVGHELIVTLSAGTKPYLLPLAEAGTVQLVWQTPDGVKSDTAMEVADGSEAVAVLPRALTAQAGEVRAEVRIYDGAAGTWTISPQFVIEIQIVIYDEDAQQEIVSSPTVYEQIVASEAGRVSAEAARELAETGRADAEAARVSAEQARVLAEAARVSAEEARALAEQARAAAEAARAAELAGKQDKLTWDDAPTEGSENALTSGTIYTALQSYQPTFPLDDVPTENSGNPVKSGGVYTALQGKQDTLTFDNAPTENSGNPVKSGGVYTALAGKQNTLTFDNAPTSGSSNPVKSGGVYTALAGKQNTLTFDNSPTENSSNPVKSSGIYTALQGKQNTLTFDNAPTSGSSNPVKSGGVYTALAGKQNTLTFDNAPTAGSNNPVKSGGINTAIANAAAAITSAVFYEAGDTLDYTGSGVMLHVYGNVRGSTSNTLRLVFPVLKLIPPELKIHFTALTLASVVIGTGGTVETEGYDALSNMTSDSPPTVWGNEIQIKLTKSGGWLKNGVSGDKVPQNTAVTGFIRAAFYFATT